MPTRHAITPEQAQTLAKWYPVPGHEGFFEVTRCGRVRSVSRYVNVFGGGKRWHKGKELKLIMNTGYPSVRRRLNGCQKTILVHRAIAEIFVPNPENKPFVNHIDGNRANSDPENLEWCTHKENMQHAHRTGLVPPSKIGPGEKSPAAKLNETQVVEIKCLLLIGAKPRDIAKLYPVSYSAIYEIRSGRSWAHVII
jgi:hypothetical protein